MITVKTIALTRRTFVGKVTSLLFKLGKFTLTLSVLKMDAIALPASQMWKLKGKKKKGREIMLVFPVNGEVGFPILLLLLRLQSVLFSFYPPAFFGGAGDSSDKALKSREHKGITASHVQA